jgi:hypothetical protein
MSDLSAPLLGRYIKRGVFYHASTFEKELIKKDEWCTSKPFDAAILGVGWTYEDLDPKSIPRAGHLPKKLIFLPGKEPADVKVHVYSFTGYVASKTIDGEAIDWIFTPIFAHELKKIATFDSWKDIRQGSKAFLGL